VQPESNIQVQVSDTITKGLNFGLTLLHDPEISSNTVVDIIFIHGLTGNAYNTWLHQESGVHWPSKLLCQDIPNARIMTWGYDANVSSFWGHTSRNRLGEHAKNLMGDVVRFREDTNTVCYDYCLNMKLADTNLTQRKIENLFLLCIA
jgi:hypothetical protein